MLKFTDIGNGLLLAQGPTTSNADWRSAYQPGMPGMITKPCGAWFRACANVDSPRMRLLTMASCVPARS